MRTRSAASGVERAGPSSLRLDLETDHYGEKKDCVPVEIELHTRWREGDLSWTIQRVCHV